MTVKRANRRIRLVVALFALVFGVALARAGWLQAVKAQGLDRLATNQHRETVDVPAHRGTIYDRLGVELAIGAPATTVYANPREIREPRLVALAVEEELGVSAEELLPKLADRSRGFVYVARQADPKDAEALERRAIVGLGFYPEERRRYPQRSVGAEVIGYAGVDNRGLAGLELRFDQILRGTGGTKTIVKDPLGHTLEVVESDSVEDGGDLHLTLDHTIQGQVERILAQTVQDWSAESASAVVLDPRTGGVLALAVEPGFDANAFPGVPPERQRNRAVTDTYEPGSTFKIVTISAALESGLVSPGTRFTLPYELKVADRVIHDAEERGTVTLSVAQILSQSSNVGVITVAQMLQSRAVHEWIKRFGFGRETGIDYPGETRGIVLPPEKWSGSTIGNVPLGQGIAVTPIQMAAAYAALANGGVWTQPHLVDRIGDGEPLEPRRRRVLSEDTAMQVRKMLRGVVETGSGTAAHVPGYRVAGKTGTAAKPDDQGGYSEYDYVASFVGFVPASRPRLVIAVAVDEPRGAIWGGTVAAPAFAEIAKFALQYLDVAPDAPGTLVASG